MAQRQERVARPWVPCVVCHDDLPTGTDKARQFLDCPRAQGFGQVTNVMGSDGSIERSIRFGGLGRIGVHEGDIAWTEAVLGAFEQVGAEIDADDAARDP